MLNYIGLSVPVSDAPSAANNTDVLRKRTLTDLLDTGTTRAFASGRIAALSAPYATKTEVDTADNAKVTPATVATADAANLALSAKGVPNGAATLDSGALVPLAQCPDLGIGFLKAAYGVASQITVDTTAIATGTAQQQLAQIDLGASGAGITFKPMAFASALMLQTANSRGALELRIGTAAQTTYASQTLIAQGAGRAFYNDYQSVSCRPAGSATGLTPASATYGPTTHYLITLWLVAEVGSVTVRQSNIVTCSAYLWRTAT